MKDSKSKKKKNDEIKITNYMDDFDEEIAVKDEEFDPIEIDIDDDDEESLDITPTDENDDADDELDEVLINEASYEDDDNKDALFEDDETPLDDDEDDEEFNGDIDDIEADERVVKKIEEETIEKPKKKRKKYRLKAGAYILVIIIIIIVIAIKAYINHQNYLKSDEYKLLQKGYTENQVTMILKEEYLTNLCLNHEYNENILSFVTEKYYLEKNLDKYLSYKEKNPNKANSEIVSIINVGANNDWYDNAKVTDTSKGNLILVNKFNYIEETLVYDDLVDMSIKYAFNGRKIRQSAYDAFIEMANAAKGENLKLVANTAYRTYAVQQAQYNNLKNQKGLAYADSLAARPGYSDHQTGLGIDISTLDTTIDFTTTSEFTWLKENAYRYGFILRYPEGKEYLTGYNYEPYHYRYVGKEAAAVIQNEKITFEEYYAYYVEGKK